MENSKKTSLPILSDIIRMMVMTRLGLAKEENRPILAMNILTKNKGISTRFVFVNSNACNT
jgi:hypothetical protein